MKYYLMMLQSVSLQVVSSFISIKNNKRNKAKRAIFIIFHLFYIHLVIDHMEI